MLCRENTLTTIQRNTHAPSARKRITFFTIIDGFYPPLYPIHTLSLFSFLSAFLSYFFFVSYSLVMLVFYFIKLFSSYVRTLDCFFSESTYVRLFGMCSVPLFFSPIVKEKTNPNLNWLFPFSMYRTRA